LKIEEEKEDNSIEHKELLEPVLEK